MTCPSPVLPAEFCALFAADWATPPALAVMLAGLLIASFARGYSGFGFSAILVASWSLVAPPSLPVAVAVMLEVSASVLQAASVWRSVDWRRIGLLLAGAVVCSPLGVLVLTLAAPSTVRLLIAALVLLCSCALLAGFRLEKPVGTAGQIGVGGVSGFVNGATAMGGLPVALFLAASSIAPATMRASFIAYFFALDILAGTLLAREGILGEQALVVALSCLPILVIGLLLGGRHFLSASPEEFRRHTLWLLVLLALIGFAKAILG
ncbi:MAG: sulfite exporter TauE/SafE family protein [Hyphomicrobiales bacterium]|nr:sulfite exporter TauE/SafE family protein [Hyphomicrobiales bacterium]MBV9052802.1 sulfite exporter TauE/SafE family protein [Hyphomicrobiales bacterium]MBV9976262.1 sulfite exporter TauE/SafE family protein [Hyphomicrobiales bacterium]